VLIKFSNKRIKIKARCTRSLVRKKYEGFTREQVIAATEARNTMAMMGHPSEAAFMKHVVSSSPVIKNCQVTLADVSNAKIIFGPERGNVKGKTVRQRPEKVRPVYVSIPRSLFEQIKNVTLAADVMFLNGLPFL
jgi:hypothetical protein